MALDEEKPSRISDEPLETLEEVDDELDDESVLEGWFDDDGCDEDPEINALSWLPK